MSIDWKAPALRPGIACVAIGLVVGLGIGWRLWRPQTVTEMPAAEIRQKDSSLVLQRAPDAHAKPTAIIPPGGTVERIVRLTVQPTPVSQPTPLPPPSEPIVQPVVTQPIDTPNVARETFLCPPVEVELALVRMPDQTRRVVASSPNGKVIGGVDIPVESAAPAKKLRWSVGATRDLLTAAWGGVVTRDVAFLRLVAIGEPAQGGRGATGKIGVALRF